MLLESDYGIDKSYAATYLHASFYLNTFTIDVQAIFLLATQTVQRTMSSNAREREIICLLVPQGVILAIFISFF